MADRGDREKREVESVPLFSTPTEAAAVTMKTFFLLCPYYSVHSLLLFLLSMSLNHLRGPLPTVDCNCRCPCDGGRRGWTRKEDEEENKENEMRWKEGKRVAWRSDALDGARSVPLYVFIRQSDNLLLLFVFKASGRGTALVRPQLTLRRRGCCNVHEMAEDALGGWRRDSDDWKRGSAASYARWTTSPTD